MAKRKRSKQRKIPSSVPWISKYLSRILLIGIVLMALGIFIGRPRMIYVSVLNASYELLSDNIHTVNSRLHHNIEDLNGVETLSELRL